MPIAFVGAIVVGGFSFAATWPGFDAKQIVVTGNHRVSREEIVARAAIARHVSIWLQNTGAIARRIEGIPYIASARVGRIPPVSIRIVVTERVPFALVESGSDAALVDGTLRVLESSSGEDGLPVLVVRPGINVRPGEYVRMHDAIALRDAYKEIASRQMAPVRLEFDRYGGLVVTMPDGIRLLLGSGADLDRKLTLANAIFLQVVAHRRRIAAIDLRAPSAPVLVYR